MMNRHCFVCLSYSAQFQFRDFFLGGGGWFRFPPFYSKVFFSFWFSFFLGGVTVCNLVPLCGKLTTILESGIDPVNLQLVTSWIHVDFAAETICCSSKKDFAERHGAIALFPKS